MNIRLDTMTSTSRKYADHSKLTNAGCLSLQLNPLDVNESHCHPEEEEIHRSIFLLILSALRRCHQVLSPFSKPQKVLPT